MSKSFLLFKVKLFQLINSLVQRNATLSGRVVLLISSLVFASTTISVLARPPVELFAVVLAADQPPRAVLVLVAVPLPLGAGAVGGAAVPVLVPPYPPPAAGLFLPRRRLSRGLFLVLAVAAVHPVDQLDVRVGQPVVGRVQLALGRVCEC